MITEPERKKSLRNGRGNRSRDQDTKQGPSQEHFSSKTSSPHKFLCATCCSGWEDWRGMRRLNIQVPSGKVNANDVAQSLGTKGINVVGERMIRHRARLRARGRVVIVNLPDVPACHVPCRSKVFKRCDVEVRGHGRGHVFLEHKSPLADVAYSVPRIPLVALANNAWFTECIEGKAGRRLSAKPREVVTAIV